MRFIVSVVEKAQVEIPKKQIKRGINKWLLVYMGISKSDCENNKGIDYKKIISKLLNTKFFVDPKTDKISLSVKDIGGEILLISNFTLYGRNKKGNKLDFSLAWDYQKSLEIYNTLVENLSKDIVVKTWEFGEFMIVKSENLGPLNYILEF